MLFKQAELSFSLGSSCKAGYSNQFVPSQCTTAGWGLDKGILETGGSATARKIPQLEQDGRQGMISNEVFGPQLHYSTCAITHTDEYAHTCSHTYTHTHKLANTLPQIWIIGHMKNNISLTSFPLTAFAMIRATAFHINYSS